MFSILRSILSRIIYMFKDSSSKRLKSSLHEAHKMTVNILRERIALIVFNNSGGEPPYVSNMTINPIIQLYSANKSIQPDPKMQQHSCE